MFTPLPQCDRLRKFPYTCQGGNKSIGCYLNKYLYDPVIVWKAITTERSASRKGTHIDEKEFDRLSKLLVPLVKDKHQSLLQIYQTHQEEIRWSYPTILKFIDMKLIPGLINLDLTKRVRYPVSYKKHKDEPTNYAFITNRTYDDFITYISEHPSIEVVEMDTVLSCKGSDACLLTLLFRKSNFMLAFLLKEKSSNAVDNIFHSIKNRLGSKLYENTFKCVLTDNGSEFANPKSIEFDNDGVKVSNLFYCDPGKSGQKGKIEKNHVELRKIFPKGTDFSLFNQSQINIGLSHVNSEPRTILNKNCPGTIAKVFLNEKVLAINEYQLIEPDSVMLHPDLLK